jgi:hypothetical protein
VSQAKYRAVLVCMGLSVACASGPTAPGESSGGRSQAGGSGGSGITSGGATTGGHAGSVGSGATSGTVGMSSGGSGATGGTGPATGGMGQETGGTGQSSGGNGAMSAGGASTGGSSNGGMSSGGSGGSSNGGGTSTGGSQNGGGGPTGGTNGGGAGGRSSGGAGGSVHANAGATSCSFPSGWKPGNPTYTTYDLPNATTACGYQGSSNNIKNIAVASNYAAIPAPSSGFSTDDRCGACVKIGNAIVTIVDECPYDGSQNKPCANNPSGHLDLSTQGASNAGVKGDPNVQGQAAWNFVPCPINGNVVVRLKQGNDNEFFIENEILPIKGVVCGSQTGSRTTYGAWHFSQNVNGQSCDVTDAADRTITVTVGSTQNQNVDTGVQFPKCQ